MQTWETVMDIELQRQLFLRFPLFFRKPGYRLSFDRPLNANLVCDGVFGEYVVHVPAGGEDAPPYRVSDRTSIDIHGIECGNWWFRIIDDVAAAFELEIREMMADGINSHEWPRAAAIKEKLGTLRFAVTGRLHPALRELLEDAETLSANTCKDCGSIGHLHNRQGVMVCLCHGCIEKRDQADIQFDLQRFLSNSHSLSELLSQREPAT